MTVTPIAEFVGPIYNKRAAKRNSDDAIIARALSIIESRIGQGRTGREVFSSPDAVKQYVSLRIGALPHEVFTVLFLDAQNRLIVGEEMFRGTLTQTSVYPREIVRRCLELHAASVVLAHNHPSGTVQPSRADEALTQTLKSALALVDVRVLDHIIVSGADSLSLAEKGLL
jgi:DNA repair protein RadC